MKKILKLADRRAVPNTALRGIRRLMREIDQGEVTGLAIVYTTRDGDIRSFYDTESCLKISGAVAQLQHRITREFFDGSSKEYS